MESHNEPGSIFDILGPIMTGPSSSHTAGAVRIGLMARHIAGADPRRAVITFYGSLSETYKGHMTDSGVVAGLLGMGVDDPGIRDALHKAGEKGMAVEIRPLSSEEKNPNTIELDIEAEGGGKHHIESITVGGGEILLCSIDGIPVDIRGKHAEILVFLKSGADIPEEISSLDAAVSMSDEGSTGGKRLLVLRPAGPMAIPVLETVSRIDDVLETRLLPCLYDYGKTSEEPPFSSIGEMLQYVASSGKSLPAAAESYESSRSGLDRQALRSKLARVWAVMDESGRSGLSGHNSMVGGLMPGDDGKRLFDAYCRGLTLSGPVLPLAIARALAAMEVNASMGCVCAAPTAGSCGVIPGVLSAVMEKHALDEDTILDGLLIAGVYGALIASRAPVSGALGGCQSEIGVASAMAAAALAQVGGGSPEVTAQAMALALKSLLGLVCDPVAGPVEVPCIKRNAVGVANAFSAADMAMAGIRSVIPPDEVIDALRNVQLLMPMELRDTTLGGLGITKTAQRLKADWMAKCSSCGEGCGDLAGDPGR